MTLAAALVAQLFQQRRGVGDKIRAKRYKQFFIQGFLPAFGGCYVAVEKLSTCQTPVPLFEQATKFRRLVGGVCFGFFAVRIRVAVFEADDPSPLRSGRRKCPPFANLRRNSLQP